MPLPTIPSVMEHAWHYKGPYRSILDVLNSKRTILSLYFNVSNSPPDMLTLVKQIANIEQSSTDSVFFEGKAHPEIANCIWEKAFWIHDPQSKFGIILAQHKLAITPMITRPDLVILTNNPPPNWVHSVLGFYVESMEIWIEKAGWSNSSWCCHSCPTVNQGRQLICLNCKYPRPSFLQQLGSDKYQINRSELI